MSELYDRLSKISTRNPYFKKDLEKARKATQFVGRGAAGSSTALYAQAAGDLGNTGMYSSTDVVFVSVNGKRPDRLPPDFVLISKAMKAHATIITDIPADRDRDYNLGERMVARFLRNEGYFEASPGIWIPN